MNGRIPTVALSLAASLAVPLAAQSRQGVVPAPRPLGPVVARSTQTFQRVLGLTVAKGNVFLNDALSRQVWMLDTSLKSGRPILDSTSGTASERWYGQSPGARNLLRFRGDSLLFIPSGAAGGQEGLIIAPDGRVARIAGLPPLDLVVGCARGNVDNTGWMTCQLAMPTVVGPLQAALTSGSIVAGDSVISSARGDSSYIIAIGLTTWGADTIGRLMTAPRLQLMVQTGAVTRGLSVQPMEPLIDQWAVFRDGTLAIARAVDYHLDIIDIHRQVTRGPRAPYEWRRFTDEEKARLLDSVRVSDSVTKARQDSIRVASAAAGNVLNPLLPRVPARLAPEEWPSYWSPFPVGMLATALQPQPAMAVDEDDRIWVAERAMPGADPGRVYGIFNKKGEFLERVRIPPTQSLAGFGAGGEVYLIEVDAGRLTLVKARYR
jgi:hypothetical protein